VHKLLTFVSSIISTLAPLAPSLALRLNLLAAQVADSCSEESDAYEFMTQAFTIYEEDISDSRAQLAAVTLASATLHHTRNFSAESYDTLATKTTQYSARLLKKPDQCRAVGKASLLFAAFKPATDVVASTEEGGGEEEAGGDKGVQGREPKRVLECLQKALKIADACKVSSMHTPLFVEVLDIYLLHYSAMCESITPKYITSLLQLVEQQLAEQEEGVANDSAQRARMHFNNIKAFMATKRASDPRFAEV